MTTIDHERLRQGVRQVCAAFPDAYWRDLDARREYPEEAVAALTKAGYLAPLIPEEYGGLGLDIGSASIILVHNHPSGDPSPSRADIEITRTIAEAGKRLGVAVHDHIVIGTAGHVSLRAQGLI